ncbi:MAG: DMT family transporter [Verrucomicrobiota bacterium]
MPNARLQLHSPISKNSLHTLALTALALVAFAGNSILCRLALGHNTIDPASFSTIRVVSGAVTLTIIACFSGSKTACKEGSWTSALALFLYAIPFSFAYTTLATGTGALILFGSVQATMITSALISGTRPHPWQWSGLGIAITGLIYLMLPGLTAPPLGAAALMALAGLSWGIYTLQGRGTKNPLAQTAGNFLRTLPMTLIASILAWPIIHLSPQGIILAITSGALASGCGYAIWYSALKNLTTIRAAVAQLLVPILAAVGGLLFLEETLTIRLLISTGIILGGVFLASLASERAK